MTVPRGQSCTQVVVEENGTYEIYYLTWMDIYYQANSEAEYQEMCELFAMMGDAIVGQGRIDLKEVPRHSTLAQFIRSWQSDRPLPRITLPVAFTQTPERSIVVVGIYLEGDDEAGHLLRFQSP